MAVSTITVTGYLLTPDGEPDAGAWLEVWPVEVGNYSSENALVSVVRYRVDTDAAGLWSVDLIASADIGGVKYNFQFFPGNNAQSFTLKRSVSGASPVTFASLPE